MAATKKKMIMKLERRFPSLAGEVLASARQEALSSGFYVLTAKGGVIYRVYPDGHREEVKRIAAPTKVQRGLRLKIR